MKLLYDDNASETIVLAAEELNSYLKRMLGEPPGEEGEIHLVCRGDRFPQSRNDAYQVQIGKAGGSIVGKNDRSVLLAVYDYLHHLGCRFLMPRKNCEIVPTITKEQLTASYEKQASFYHRGVCIEGADSFENIMDYIEWLPKVGFNSFFLQFQTPYAFLSRWYGHVENPYRKGEAYTQEDAGRDMELLEAEIKKRGLLLHAAGHGWTGAVLGYRSVSWKPEEKAVDAGLTHRMAMIDGKRELYGGVPTNTNLCYHDPDAVDAFVELVLEYAGKHPGTDYLHVWLADEYNNLCECPECSRTTLSDQYVELLNKIDERLTAEKLKTRIVFLLYQELLWPPVLERIRNQERFVLMFAPISRTFEKSYELEQPVGGGKDSGWEIPQRKLPEFVRNHVTLPVDLAENIAFLRGWQEVFTGDSFVYDYPLGRAHYGDFGYVHMAEVIHDDIQKLHRMGLDGYISCQELRAALPNALPDYMMAYTLFDEEALAEDIIAEYFSACYGSSWKRVLSYLSGLSDLSSCDYVNGKGARVNPEMAERMERVRSSCEEFEQETMLHRGGDGGWENLYWEVLEYHRNYVMLFSDALRSLALGEAEQADEKWNVLRESICNKEETYQPFLDVYRILEVTRKYTGFHSPDR